MVIAIILWFILALLVASAGSNKNIGYWGAFFISLIFSPLIGLLFVLVSGNATVQPKTNPQVYKLSKQAVKQYNEGNYNDALTTLLGSLEIDARNPLTHFNIASLHSLLKNEQKCIFHLQKAFEFGFTDTQKLSASTDLQWIKQQPVYEVFIQNGYKL